MEVAYYHDENENHGLIEFFRFFSCGNRIKFNLGGMLFFGKSEKWILTPHYIV